VALAVQPANERRQFVVAHFVYFDYGILLHLRLAWANERFGYLFGGVSRNPRKFRHPSSSPATIASRSIICPLPRKV
jgi:hypothetical protein